MDLIMLDDVTTEPAPRLGRDPHRLGEQRVTGPAFLAWVKTEMLLADAFFRRAASEPDHDQAEAMRDRAEAIYQRLEDARMEGVCAVGVS